MHFLSYFLSFLDASNKAIRTAKFDPTNNYQLWKQDSRGRLINKAVGVWGVDALWTFNTCIRSSQEPTGPISQKLQLKSYFGGEQCLNTDNRFDTTGSNLGFYPCKTIHPINGCFRFK